MRHEDRDYLPLTEEVLTAHLTGDVHLGLYPLLDGDRCWWLAADFDGDAAMLDALAYLKAARASGVPGALEVSKSGVGAHVWIFFAPAVPAETVRRLGTGPLREAMALRGRMDLASYDRLFPSQDEATAQSALKSMRGVMWLHPAPSICRTVQGARGWSPSDAGPSRLRARRSVRLRQVCRSAGWQSV